MLFYVRLMSEKVFPGKAVKAVPLVSVAPSGQCRRQRTDIERAEDFLLILIMLHRAL